MSLVEHIVPGGSASPWHVHRTKDESFDVVSGQLTVIVEVWVKTADQILETLAVFCRRISESGDYRSFSSPPSSRTWRQALAASS
jgi:hypothetical protein